MTLTTTSSGEYVVYFNAEMTANNSRAKLQIVLNIDGVDQAVTTRDFGVSSSGDYLPDSTIFKTGILSPSQVIKVRWRRLSGASMVSTKNRTLIIDNQ
jgi:hypothetical protein